MTQAYSINDAGWITGLGRRGGVYSQFLLRPVPEPASIIALATGAALLLKRRRRS